MKIFKDDKVYVQLNDLAYLNSYGDEIPASIYLKVFGDGITIINDSNRYEFVEFDEPSEIEFFKGIDWMVDYNSIKDLSDQEIMDMGEQIAIEQSDVVLKYNNMTIDERRQNANLITRSDLLEFKFYSLRDILWFKQGHLNITLPDGVPYPESYKKSKGLKKAFKRKNQKNTDKA